LATLHLPIFIIYIKKGIFIMYVKAVMQGSS